MNVYNLKSVIINNMFFYCFVGEKCIFLGLNNYLIILLYYDFLKKIDISKFFLDELVLVIFISEIFKL